MSDPDFSQVAILFNCDGTAGSTTFTDLSTHALTITPGGGGNVTTTNPKFGTGCLHGDGTKYVAADIVPGGPLDLDGDFTLECWVRWDTLLFGATSVYQVGDTVAGATYMFVGHASSGQFLIQISGGTAWSGITTPVGTVTVGPWYHIAVVRNGNNGQLYVNGVGSSAPVTDWVGAPTWGAKMSFGGTYSGTGFGTIGATDEFRVSRFARYTSDFTPPTDSFPTEGPSDVPVPDVVGETLAAATTDITGGDLTLGAVTYEHSDLVAAGLVISQDPASGGADVPIGTTVDLVVSLGPVVLVPDVVGETLADATTEIVAATFVLGAVTSAYSGSVAVGLVISQNPIAGAEASAGDAIAVVISLGPAPVQGPPLNLDATIVTRLHVILVWDEPLINGPFEYVVYRDNLLIGTTAEDIKTFEDTNVVAGVTYRYTVAGWDSGAEENLTPLSDEEVVEIPTQLVFPPVVFAALGDAKPRIYEPKENLVVRGHE